MPVYEIVYETGTHALAEYSSDEEAQAALQEHHNRAKTGVTATPESQERSDLAAGEVAGATSWPAERVAKVYKFDFHPANYRIDESVPAEEVVAVLESLKDANGHVNAQEAAAAVRTTSSPFSNSPDEPFSSMYAMEHTELELDLDNNESAGE